MVGEIITRKINNVGFLTLLDEVFQRDHKVIQDQIEGWKSPPTPLKYNFNDY